MYFLCHTRLSLLRIGPLERYPSPRPPLPFPEERRFGGQTSDFHSPRYDDPPQRDSPQPPFLHRPDAHTEEHYLHEREREPWYRRDRGSGFGDFHHPSPPPNHGLDDRGQHRNSPFGGAALPPPPTGPLLRPKTVPAERVFDQPCRSERPSHVSHSLIDSWTILLPEGQPSLTMNGGLLKSSYCWMGRESWHAIKKLLNLPFLILIKVRYH